MDVITFVLYVSKQHDIVLTVNQVHKIELEL